MTILYKVQGVCGCKEGNVLLQNSVLCRISKKNLVVFCVHQNLHSQLYICDIVKPWQNYKICSSKAVASVLEWNPTGELLLVGYKHGLAEIWGMKANCMNSWFLLYTVNLPCEEIINVKFFHNSKATYFNMQKKDLQNYSDKYERLDQRPTLAHFGCSPVEGCFLLTASGLMGVFTIPRIPMNPETSNSASPSELNIFTNSIGLSRCFITHCSISYCPTGRFNVAINNWSEPRISCFKIGVEREQDETLNLKCGAMASIFLQRADNENKEISVVHWRTVNCEEVAFVVYDCIEGSFIEQWNLIKKHQQVHKLLQKNKSDFMQWEQWEITAKLSLTSRVCDLSLSKLPTESLLLFAILRDNSVQILETGLKKIGSTVFERVAEDQMRAPCKLLTSDCTHLNQLLILFDNLGQMYAMQVPTSHYDKNYKMSPLAVPVCLLEYSVITGIDAADVLMLNLSHLEALTEKLTENFSRQTAYVRHFYYSNFLSLKSNICRIQTKQQDFDDLITLHAIAIAFKSLLRPSDLSSQDKGPAENLSMILSEPVGDVDKVLCVLDAKDFTVEPATLQSLQQLIQWVSDLALNILHKLTEDVLKPKFNKRHGYEICRDVIAVSSVRELLVMIRIWGLLNPHCLPIYTKSVDNFDVLPVMFRLLTRLMQNTSEPDDSLLDECSVLSTQVLVPTRHINTPTTLLNSNATSKLFPFVFQTSVESLNLQDVHYEEVLFSHTIKDDVSNLHLGTHVRSLRICSRCGFINNINKMTKTAALKTWYQRWKYCHCGGFWKFVSF